MGTCKLEIDLFAYIMGSLLFYKNTRLQIVKLIPHLCECMQFVFFFGKNGKESEETFYNCI